MALNDTDLQRIGDYVKVNMYGWLLEGARTSLPCRRYSNALSGSSRNWSFSGTSSRRNAS